MFVENELDSEVMEQKLKVFEPGNVRFEMCFRKKVYLTTLCRIRRAERYYRYCSQSCGESVNKCKEKS